ncbi:MAG: hypothetical protein ACI9N0_001085 [Ilumatobacter sp.]|jgi:hypothetical protein
MTAQSKPGRYDVTKVYPQRGPLQQYRVATATSFACFRCGNSKTSKLVTVFRDDWGHLLCNGCYGRLLSLYELRSGQADAVEIADALANELLSLLSNDEVRRAEELLRLRDARSELLEPKALRLLATAEYVAGQLQNATDLDWSAAVIGLCKAVEIEAVGRLVDPLAAATAGADLADDVADKDLGRVAKYCASRSAKSPELGAIRHFLVTAASSQERQASSPLLLAFRDVLRRWPGGDWLVERTGASFALEVITTSYRNPAAHTEELTETDYLRCADFVLGESGVLWSLITATTSR